MITAKNLHKSSKGYLQLGNQNYVVNERKKNLTLSRNNTTSLVHVILSDNIYDQTEADLEVRQTTA